MQGGSFQRQWSSIGGTSVAPIAVSEFVRTTAFTSGSGAEYTLEGADTGNRYPHPGGIGSFYDSTTDGEFNYVVQFGGGHPVFRTDPDYGNPVKLFNAPGSINWLGITFDASDNSLWLAQWGGTRIVNIDMGGNILSEFTSGHTLNTALALDPADNTLWVGDRGVPGRYVNYDKDGTKLGEMTVGAISADNTLGGEFVTNAAPGCLPCDADCDGSVDLTDVEPFIALVLGKTSPCDWCSGDTNDDGSVDLADVELFIECMLG